MAAQHMKLTFDAHVHAVAFARGPRVVAAPCAGLPSVQHHVECAVGHRQAQPAPDQAGDDLSKSLRLHISTDVNQRGGAASRTLPGGSRRVSGRPAAAAAHRQAAVHQMLSVAVRHIYFTRPRQRSEIMRFAPCQVLWGAQRRAEAG